ncbi:ABC transporter permease [Oleiharenicola sp. Vm1]|uniref:ABC transporter permease n=1 Tax=Oleiharenicola sp. Vm1 TaxID=3398393 RepID=UPI0039F5DB11
MLSDLRLSLRTLAKSPLFCVVAIVTLGLGIGVNTAMFSIIDAILWRGLPFPEQERIVAVVGRNEAQPRDRFGMSWAEFEDFRRGQRSFADVAALEDRTTTLSGPGGEPERIAGTATSASGMTMLPGPLALGRWFTAEDDQPGAPGTIVLSHALWTNRFKADPAIVGRQIKVNSEWTTIVGVAAEGFRFPEDAGAFVPMRDLHLKDKRDERGLTIFGRLKPGVTLAQAHAEVAAFGAQLAKDHGDTNRGVTFGAQTLFERFSSEEDRQLFGVMLGAVLLVMLIACANVGNLLLARSSVREKELAVRAALGAGRARVVRLLLAEALLLSCAGAAFGCVIAAGSLEVFRRAVADAHPPYWMHFDLDGAALLYAAGLAGASCLLAGLYPAWRHSRPDLNTVLKDAGRGSTSAGVGRFARLMIVGEVALSCLLLVLSGLTIRSVIQTQALPLGFTSAGIYSGRVALLDREYDDVAKQKQFFSRLIERLRERPEIADFTLSDMQPTWDNSQPILIEGRAPEAAGKPPLTSSCKAVAPHFFSTLGIGLLQGRDFTDADSAQSQQVAIVNTAFVQKYWPNQEPLGRRFHFGAGKPGEKEDWLTVVGVVTPIMEGRFNAQPGPQAYVPFTQSADVRRMTVMAKARGGDAVALAPVLRQTVSSLSDDLPVYFAQTLDQMLEEARFSKRIIAWIFGVFGAVALVLAGVGLYGVMSYSVAQRTSEIGVRVALGATPRDVLGLVLRQSGGQIGLGLALGLGVSFFAGQLMAGFLYAVSPRDPGTFIGTVLALGLAGTFATLVPALRALRVNPVVALRNE